MQWFAIGYGVAAFITAVVVLVMSNRISDWPRPLSVRVGFSLAAGVLWPLMVLGLLEFGSFVAYTKVAEPEETPLDIDIDIDIDIDVDVNA